MAVITISRQFGAGGITLGKMIAWQILEIYCKNGFKTVGGAYPKGRARLY
jgi:hypothetical protein